MRQIEHAVWLETTPEAAYDYTTAPEHWCRWYPGTVAVEGHAGVPLAAGDTFTERVRTLGVLGNLRWTTVESARPWRFVAETTSVELPLMRRARMKITYSFEPPGKLRERHIRMVRTFEYEFTGVARALDRVYLHKHLKQTAAFALAKLQELIGSDASDGFCRHAVQGKAPRRRPNAIQRFAHASLSTALVVFAVPLLSMAALARAVFLRVVRGKATQILRIGQAPYRAGRFYVAQMVFEKPFDPSQLQEVFFEMVREAGIDPAKARVDLEQETPRPLPASGAVEANHYVGQRTNWLRGKRVKGLVLWLRLFAGNTGTPTVVQAGLPVGSWDGTSCFNFMKELVSRCCGGQHADIFQGKRLTLRPESARVLDRSSFLAFLARLPRNVAVNTWSGVWNWVGATRPLGGPGVRPELVLLNFDEADSAGLQAGLETLGVKPYAALAFAAVDAYNAVLGQNPYSIIQQSSLQTRHYEPKLERTLVGDWLIGPVQRIPKDRYTLEDAQRGYQRLVRDLDILGEDVRRAFDAKAYGFSTEAGRFEALPTYGLDARTWDSIFFNNYGVRSVCPEAALVSWNWIAPFKLSFNAINVNGKTCITFASYVLGLENLREVRDRVERTLRDFMALAPLA
ncbi:MAG TPA: SRPBCC family protein [Bryobacteraceae bacterium]|nr:SRPBCC family protein [Bryobacteraceae bacterium]